MLLSFFSFIKNYDNYQIILSEWSYLRKQSEDILQLLLQNLKEVDLTFVSFLMLQSKAICRLCLLNVNLFKISNQYKYADHILQELHICIQI